MKAMLRTVLFLDAVLNLALGALLIASFWSSLYATVDVPVPSPVLYAQLLGVAFVGTAWLQWHATVNGQLTATVAKVTGHVNWVSGAFVLGWLIAGQLAQTLGGKMLLGAFAVVLVVIGLILVKLAGSVRTKERVQAAERTRGEVSGGVVQAAPPPVPPTRTSPDYRDSHASDRRSEPQLDTPPPPPVKPAGNTGIVTPVSSATAPTSNESTSSVTQDARQNPHS